MIYDEISLLGSPLLVLIVLVDLGDGGGTVGNKDDVDE